jgi:hypothetical protein
MGIIETEIAALNYRFSGMGVVQLFRYGAAPAFNSSLSDGSEFLGMKE